MSEVLTADLVVVGAGPAGLYATYYAGFRGMSVVVVDALAQPGGQMTALYPEKPVFDVAGFPGCAPRTWSTTWSPRPRWPSRPTSWATARWSWRRTRTASRCAPTGAPRCGPGRC
ncbi:NAD(P)-binding protein [Klenkia terrae]|uniref:NAD(P)-binding protein n=1 Tax=Klenkia terrae TaxID=1052259 RepID=UPI00360DD7A1